MTRPDPDHLLERTADLLDGAPFILVHVDLSEPDPDPVSGMGTAAVGVVVHRMDALQVAMTLAQLVPPALAEVSVRSHHEHLVEHLRDDLEQLDNGEQP